MGSLAWEKNARFFACFAICMFSLCKDIMFLFIIFLFYFLSRKKMLAENRGIGRRHYSNI